MDAEASRTVAVVTPQTVDLEQRVVSASPTTATANRMAPTATLTGSDQAVQKCARFFRTLLQLSEKQQNNQEEVKRLVRDLVFGGLPPEDFTVSLQRALNSQAQSNLQPFLRQTLPALRKALQSGQQVIEGIGTAEDYAKDIAGGGDASNGQQHSINSTNTIFNNNNNFASTSNAQQPSTPLNNGRLESEDALDTSIDSVIHNNVVGTSTQQQQHQTIAIAAAPATAGPGVSETGGPSVLTRPQTSSINIQHIMSGTDVLEIISNAAETRFKALIAHLAVASEHRLEPLRLTPTTNKWTSRENSSEREALIRFSKSKGKDKDTMEKAKQVQKADKEAAMNREANAAAIAALGGSRGVKRPGSTNANNNPTHSSTAISNNPLQESAAAGLSVQCYRPRVKRVTMRDLQFVLRTDPFTTSSSLRHKIVLSRVGTSSSANDNLQQ
uniref:TAFH domain-containing protein n=1 Tax=Ditylenchus dipsaci TaxID=166011 RepID=A0A915CR97_9BILA